MQLWKKQNISAFKSSWSKSKVILIEKHFKPTCSRITSTTHSAIIRKRWSANWAMWSHSSCAKQYQKYNVLNVFLYWNQGIVSCTYGHFLVDSESRRKLNKLRLDALSIPHYVIKKGRCHGARHGKTEEQKEYHITWNAWKRCCKRVDSQRYPRSLSKRPSRSWIATQNWLDRAKEVHRDGRVGTARSHAPSL